MTIQSIKLNLEKEDNEFLSHHEMVQLYRTMYLIRRFEETANDLYMLGKIPSTLHLYIGQEAVAAGVTANLRLDDYVLSTHRPHGHALAKGVSPNSIMAELFGKRTGSCKGKGGSMHIGDMKVGVLPAIAIVGGNAPIAAGAALAFKMQKTDRVVVSFFGDGAANEGAWHESLNASAIYSLPVIYVCENNLYGASTSFQSVYKIENIAQRATAYGIPGYVVDGNDVKAVYQISQEAVNRARTGNGPTLIECMTYRLCGHSRSDPRTYRTKEEEEAWRIKDPIPNFRHSILTDQILSEVQLKAIEQEVEKIIQDAIEFAESSPIPNPEDAYTDVFKE